MLMSMERQKFEMKQKQLDKQFKILQKMIDEYKDDIQEQSYFKRINQRFDEEIKQAQSNISQKRITNLQKKIDREDRLEDVYEKQFKYNQFVHQRNRSMLDDSVDEFNYKDSDYLLEQQINNMFQKVQKPNKQRSISRQHIPQQKKPIKLLKLQNEDNITIKRPINTPSVLQIDPPPPVTANAWSIFDVENHVQLFGFQPHQKREVASLTKIMTLLVALDIIKKFDLNYKNLYFIVTQSASELIGTTANLQNGDIISLEDLLYGIMLPSGNDAAQCVAEYLVIFKIILLKF